MAVTLSFIGGAGWQFFDNNGDPLSGGMIYTYAAGTTTPLATYTSRTGTTANSNPIVLDAAGRTPQQVWATDGVFYKYVVTDANNVLIRTWDNIGNPDSAAQLATNLADTTDNAKGDALIGFKQSNSAGFLTGATGRTVNDKLQEIVSFRDFGAVGDGTTDDLTAIRAAVASPATIIDGNGLTYKISDTIQITRSNLTIRNAKFVGPLTGPVAAASSTPTFLEFIGSEGSSITLSSNAAKGATQVALSSVSGLSAEQWVRFQSQEVLWGTVNLAGELAKIKSISGNIITLYDGLYLGYTTANSSSVVPLTMRENIALENVTVAGNASTTNQTGVLFRWCSNVTVRNFQSTDCQYAHIGFFTCADNQVLGGIGERTSTDVGLNYGVIIAFASYNTLVNGYTGRAMRHTVTTGGSTGLNRYVKAVNCVCVDAIDAGLDAHGSTAEINYSYNYISGQTGTGADGIICQGEQFTCIGNMIYNVPRHGIFHQPLMKYSGAGATLNAANNTIQYVQAASSTTVGGIYATASVVDSPFNAVTITGNFVNGAPYGVNVYASDEDMSNIVVSNNTLENISSRGVYVRADAGMTIRGVNILGNISRLDAGANENVYLQCVSTGVINLNAIDANILDAGTYGIRLGGTTTTQIGAANVLANGTSGTVFTSGDTGTTDNRVLSASVTYNPPSLAAGARDTTTVTLTGVEVGDMVTGVSHSTSLFSGDVVLYGYVSATDTVLVVYDNQGAVTRDVSSGTLRVTARKAAT